MRDHAGLLLKRQRSKTLASACAPLCAAFAPDRAGPRPPGQVVRGKAGEQGGVLRHLGKVSNLDSARSRHDLGRFLHHRGV
jgi:hypothetical protein